MKHSQIPPPPLNQPPENPPPDPKSLPQNNKSLIKLNLPFPILHHPQPIPPPAINPNLPEESFLIRSAESIEFAAKQIEYSISPSGHLRAFLKFCLLIFLYVSIPIVLFLPLITYFLGEFNSISEYLFMSSKHLFQSLVYLAGCAIAIITALALFRTFIRT